jgi:hypothetical protein
VDADVRDVRLLDCSNVSAHSPHVSPVWRLQDYRRWPCSSSLEKQLSVILFRSSSKRSARDMPDGVELELVVDGGPRAPPVDGRLVGARGSPKPLG